MRQLDSVVTIICLMIIVLLFLAGQFGGLLYLLKVLRIN